MSFIQRLAYYLLGLLLGLFIVFYYLDVKDTQFCYLPNCRVLKDIRNKPFHVDPQAQALYNQMTKEEVKIFLTNGDVDFERSKKEMEGGKLYIIEGKDKNLQDMTFEVINYTDKVVLKKIYYNDSLKVK